MQYPCQCGVYIHAISKNIILGKNVGCMCHPQPCTQVFIWEWGLCHPTTPFFHWPLIIVYGWFFCCNVSHTVSHQVAWGGRSQMCTTSSLSCSVSLFTWPQVLLSLTTKPLNTFKNLKHKWVRLIHITPQDKSTLLELPVHSQITSQDYKCKL